MTFLNNLRSTGLKYSSIYSEDAEADLSRASKDREDIRYKYSIIRMQENITLLFRVSFTLCDRI